MIKIKFSNGSLKEYTNGILVSDIATSISLSLSKKTVAAIINNKHIVGKEYGIYNNCEIDFITSISDPRLRNIIGKTAAICAANTLQTFHSAQIFRIGFSDLKFYVDFLCKENIKENILGKINIEVIKILKKNLPIKLKTTSSNQIFYELNNQLYSDPYGYLDNTNKVGAIKLLSISGVYLNNNNKNSMFLSDNMFIVNYCSNCFLRKTQWNRCSNITN